MRKTQQNKRFKPIYFTATKRKTALQPILIRVAHRADKRKVVFVCCCGVGWDNILMLGENAQRPGRWPPFNKGSFAWCVRNGVNWFVVNGWRVICVGSVVCVRRGLLLVRVGG